MRSVGEAAEISFPSKFLDLPPNVRQNLAEANRLLDEANRLIDGKLKSEGFDGVLLPEFREELLKEEGMGALLSWLAVPEHVLGASVDAAGTLRVTYAKS